MCVNVLSVYSAYTLAAAWFDCSSSSSYKPALCVVIANCLCSTITALQHLRCMLLDAVGTYANLSTMPTVILLYCVYTQLHSLLM
jgi:hypothetical protein